MGYPTKEAAERAYQNERVAGAIMGGATAAPREPDAIDRQRELLRSSVDFIQNQTSRLRDILDRSLGGVPATVTPPITPDRPFESSSVNDWLDSLSRAHNELADQLSRVREQMR